MCFGIIVGNLNIPNTPDKSNEIPEDSMEFKNILQEAFKAFNEGVNSAEMVNINTNSYQ